MKEIPPWVVIAAGAIAVAGLVWGKQLGMDLSPATIATIGAVVGAVVNFLGRSDSNDRDRKGGGTDGQ